ncbi:MAG: methyltransferase domain-containing protein [Candidatus Hodarchaeales archaeon]|jgi:cyclopropane fatty-acyl-phospholipid synthase-like methyltransferase
MNKSISEEIIELVRKGYLTAALPYRKQKDDSIIHLKIFQEWLSQVKNGPILELGCGAGFPVAKAILEADKDYYGIDLAESQIKLAKKEFSSNKDSFHVAEMLSFCKQAKSSLYGGIISLFSIRHLPRIYHVELFTLIRRILMEDAPILLSAPISSGEGTANDWFNSKMYWSHFSYKWYHQTLSELGFKLIMKFREEKIFLGENEVTWYLLFKK